MKKRIYLDYNATTPVLKEVLKAMLPYLQKNFGNPSSIHNEGRIARNAVEDARRKVASAIGASQEEIFFTSGATEANNMAIFGASLIKKKGHIITSPIEHPSVLEPLQKLSKNSFCVSFLKIDEKGRIDIDDLIAKVKKDTFLISIAIANNEIGNIYPVEKIGKTIADKNIFFHIDAAQGLGKIKMNVKDISCDFMTISSHKSYGPKGVGALYIKRGIKISPFIFGGHQEKNMRSGTESVHNIVGFGKACEIVCKNIDEVNKRIEFLMKKLLNGIMEKIDGVSLNGDEENRLSNTLNLSFDGIEAESLLISLDLEGVSISSGSACTSGSLSPSHVLTAMGVSPERIKSAVRISIGRFTTEEEIKEVLEILPPIIERIRSISPLHKTKQRQE